MLAYIFVILAIASRFLILKLVPHPWDFTPLAASLLYFWRPRTTTTVVGARRDVRGRGRGPQQVHLLLSSDLGPVHQLGVVRGSSLPGHAARDRSKPVWVMGAALTSSLSFFLVSNFGVWAAYNIIPQDATGPDFLLCGGNSLLSTQVRRRSAFHSRALLDPGIAEAARWFWTKSRCLNLPGGALGAPLLFLSAL